MSSRMGMHVLLVHRHLLVRQAIAIALDGTPGIESVDHAEDEPSAVALVRALRPDVAVVAPLAAENGPLLVSSLVREHSGLAVVAFSPPGDGPLQIARLVDAGARTVLPFRAAFTDLLDALCQLAGRGASADTAEGVNLGKQHLSR